MVVQDKSGTVHMEVVLILAEQSFWSYVFGGFGRTLNAHDSFFVNSIYEVPKYTYGRGVPVARYGGCA